MSALINRPRVLVSPSRQHDPTFFVEACLRAGFKQRAIGFCIVVDARGQIAAIDDLPPGGGVGQSNRMLWVPVSGAASSASPPGFLWDKAGVALGAQRDRRQPGGYRLAPAAFQAFRAHQETLLRGTPDIALRCFLRFLGAWSPDQLQSWPELIQRIDQNVVFRFSYDDEFLHERHHARLTWQRAIAPSSPTWPN
jgi:hypothetical protein